MTARTAAILFRAKLPSWTQAHLLHKVFMFISQGFISQTISVLSAACDGRVDTVFIFFDLVHFCFLHHTDDRHNMLTI